MPFTIELLDPQTLAPYEDVPRHPLSYRNEMGETNSSLVHLSNMDDVWHYDALARDCSADRVAIVLLSVIDHGENPHPEIVAALCLWAMLHPEGLWRAA